LRPFGHTWQNVNYAEVIAALLNVMLGIAKYLGMVAATCREQRKAGFGIEFGENMMNKT